jgi:hypothetical protein
VCADLLSSKDESKEGILNAEVNPTLLPRASLQANNPVGPKDVRELISRDDMRDPKTVTLRSSKLRYTIPKQLWMFWDKGLDHLKSLATDPDNKYFLDYICVTKMIELNPNWDINILSEDDGKKLAPMYSLLLNNETLYPKLLPRMKSDFLRMELLSRYGGVWADTSICPFVGLDRFIGDWVGEGEDGFFAISLENNLGSVRGKDLPLNVSTCHDADKVPGSGGEFRTASNYFMATTSPHNPLVDEWLSTYRDYLVSSPDPRKPCFLTHCSLTRARMKNETVDAIWTSTRRRTKQLNMWSKTKANNKPCAGGENKPLSYYKDECAFVKKPHMAKELKQYVTSPQFMGNQILEQEDKVVKGLNVSDIRLPGILLAGVQKSGSTALDDFLSLQAGVCLSRPNPDIDKEKKEVHFYDNKELYSKGVPFYSSLFAHCDNMRHTADGTPNTFSFPERVKETYDLAGKTALEELKIVIVLREPVSRELSWYNHIAASCRTDIEGCNFKGRVLKNEPKAQFRTFTEYSDFVFDDYNIDGMPKWKQQSLTEGVYGENIEQWFHHFDRKQILVLSYDELKENETSFLHRVLSFLGLYVDLAMIDSGTKHVNTYQSSSKVKLPSCDTQKKLAKMFKPSNDKLYQLIDDEKGEQPTEQQQPFPRFVLSNCTNHNDSNRKKESFANVARHAGLRGFTAWHE